MSRRTNRWSDEADDNTPVRPLPPRLAAMSSRQRVVLALVGIVVGVGLMFLGLKLVNDDVNPKPAPSSQNG